MLLKVSMGTSPRCNWLEVALERFQKGPDFGIRPVCGAHVFAADIPVSVDDVGFGPHVGVEELRGRLRRVPNRDEVDMAAGDKARVLIGIFVNAHAQNHEIGLVVVKLNE